MRPPMKELVAEAMAEGDTVDTWPSGRQRVRPARSQAIAEKLGVSAVHVRSTQARIRRDLGPQATERDLGWRPTK